MAAFVGGAVTSDAGGLLLGATERATKLVDRFAADVTISLFGKGNCFDNAMVETFFKTLKSKLIWRTSFLTRADAQAAIARYIDGFYSPVRRHSTLDYISPMQFERNAAE